MESSRERPGNFSQPGPVMFKYANFGNQLFNSRNQCVKNNGGWTSEVYMHNLKERKRTALCTFPLWYTKCVEMVKTSSIFPPDIVIGILSLCGSQPQKRIIMPIATKWVRTFLPNLRQEEGGGRLSFCFCFLYLCKPYHCNRCECGVWSSDFLC